MVQLQVTMEESVLASIVIPKISPLFQDLKCTQLLQLPGTRKWGFLTLEDDVQDDTGFSLPLEGAKNRSGCGYMTGRASIANSVFWLSYFVLLCNEIQAQPCWSLNNQSQLLQTLG